jgi:hypothetical protein
MSFESTQSSTGCVPQKFPDDVWFWNCVDLLAPSAKSDPFRVDTDILDKCMDEYLNEMTIYTAKWPYNKNGGTSITF